MIKEILTPTRTFAFPAKSDRILELELKDKDWFERFDVECVSYHIWEKQIRVEFKRTMANRKLQRAIGYINDYINNIC